MADNSRLNPGAGGDLVAADDITDGGVANGAKVQRVKAGFGADGAFTDVSAGNPLPVTVGNLPATQPVSGTVSVGNFPATQPVSGTVSVGNLPATQPVSGTVSVGNWPAAQPVTDNGGSLTVDGTVGVSGTVAVDGSGHTQPVSDGGGSLTVDGTVNVGNWPATQPVSGTVSVGNFPASQPVSLSGTVTVDSEMPAAAALADATANPTTPTVGADGMVFNGATWDRVRSASAAAGTTGPGVAAAGMIGWDGAAYQRARVDTDGTQAVVERADNAVLTSVTASVSSVSLLAARAARKMAIIWNESTATLYLAFAATASTTAYTYQVPPGGYAELPRSVYTGAISGIWSAANGAARITELY